MSLSARIAPFVPFLRRYARALTGSQASGDAYAVATLEAILAAPDQFPAKLDPRVGLYRVFHAVWATAQVPDAAGAVAGDRREAVVRERLGRLLPRTRQALLLTMLEGFARQEVADILDTTAADVQELLEEALADIDRQTATHVLIIEDEPIISMDLEGIVRSLGHTVAAVARTRKEAVDAARRTEPGLVLADIKLADGSSGIDAVKDILGSFSVPVIFITAYPERLLTGERPEPTFLITKPFQTDAVKAAISQALFFDTRASVAGAMTGTDGRTARA